MINPIYCPTDKEAIVMNDINFILPYGIKFSQKDFDSLVQEMIIYYDFNKGRTIEFEKKLNETIINYLI
jgi:hypothetical protein